MKEEEEKTKAAESFAEFLRSHGGAARRKLDNVALAFPAATGKKDSRVFRIYCVLNEDIREDILRRALLSALKSYPLFHSVLKRGRFWFYLEKSDIKPDVFPEDDVPCRPIYKKSSEDILYRMTYGKNRINLEIFHALTDGTGAIEFLSETVKNYLDEAHALKPEDRDEDRPGTEERENKEDKAEGDAGKSAGGVIKKVTVYEKPGFGKKHDVLRSLAERFRAQEEDSFSKYYSRKKQAKQVKKPGAAFQIKKKKVSQDRMRITECIISLQDILAKARSYDSSITVYLTAVLMKAVESVMSDKDKEKPVRVMLPVNLRKYYPSETMSNFFGLMGIEYDFTGDEEHDSLPEVIAHVKRRFAEDLTDEQVAARMNQYIRLEKNPLLKYVPLSLKNFFLKIGTDIGGGISTVVFSNMSAVKLPEVYAPYVRSFGAIASTDKLQMSACSYKDEFYLSITSKFEDSDIQREFLRLIKREGLVFKEITTSRERSFVNGSKHLPARP